MNIEFVLDTKKCLNCGEGTYEDYCTKCSKNYFYCQSANCYQRGKRIPKEQMIKVGNFMFCSQECTKIKVEIIQKGSYVRRRK